MAKTGRESVQQMLRLPDDLRDSLREAAESHGRSLNAEIVQRLIDSFDVPKLRADVIGLTRVTEVQKELENVITQVAEQRREIIDLHRDQIAMLKGVAFEALSAIQLAASGDEHALRDLIAKEKRNPREIDFMRPGAVVSEVASDAEQ